MNGTADLDEYRRTVRTWLAEQLEPRGDEVREVHDLTAEELAAGRARQRAQYEAGYVGITVPKEYGGQGLSEEHQQIWREESASYAIPLPAGVASMVTLGVVLPTLLANATEDQKRAWIPPLLQGDHVWVQLLSEPGAGSDLAGILTRATRDGDRWILNGTKLWSSGAMWADYGLCLARTDWDVPKHRGLTWFRVPLHDDRVTVRPVRQINGSMEFCEEFLDDVLLGDDDVIGPVNGGWAVANSMLVFERGIGHDEVPGGKKDRRGFAPDLVELAREQGSAGDGAVRQLIARAHTEDWAFQLLSARITSRLQSGVANPAEASMVKLANGMRDPERAIAGATIAGRSAVAWRDEGEPGELAASGYLYGRQFSIAGGSNEIQRNVVSERVLGLPREPSHDRDKPFRDVLRDARKWTDDAG
jgi:alkylation response protein AidB-like acyl-CoA dehydrogenase